MTITALCFQLGSLATAPVPESAIATFAVQRVLYLLGEMFTAEKNLGFDVGVISLTEGLADADTFPLTAAATAASAVANYATLKWDQARVDKSMNEFEGLVDALDEAAPGWTVNGPHGIASYFRYLLWVHVRKLLMLSSVSTSVGQFYDGQSIDTFAASPEKIGWDNVYESVLVQAAYLSLSATEGPPL